MHLGVRDICLVLTVVQALITGGWATYALSATRGGSSSGGGGRRGHQRSGPGYLAVPSGE